ncbi:MAG: histidine kinase [Verrucomicrobiota bacterium]
MLLSIAGACAAPETFDPYEADADTLHLWHLDESKVPFADIENGTPLRGLLNGARAGQPSLPGFGKAVSFNANVGGTSGSSDLKGAILIPNPGLHNGGEDNAPSGFRYFGTGGAFTFEMVVRFDVLPHDSPNIALDLLTMEGDGADRIFNFRIEKEGFLVFVPLPHCGASGGAIATIPASGPNMPDTESWFHVAVTYNGNDGMTNNLKLYWTRVGSGALAANYIGSGTLSNDLNGLNGDLAIGNEAREFFQNAEAEPFPGLIDEVRISGVARHPTDFFFVPPELRLNPKHVQTDAAKVEPPPVFNLELIDVLVDSAAPAAAEGPGTVLQLGPGLHRLDFDFGFRPDTPDQMAEVGSWQSAVDMKLRCQLQGIDDQWQETEVGMGLVCQMLDEKNQVVSQSRFPAVGRSDGWKTTLEDSTMTRRLEPVYVPAGAKKLRLILNSGSPDTTGFFGIDYFGLQTAGDGSPSLLENGVFSYNAYTTSPAGSPQGWQRGGEDSSIARMILRPDRPGIGLVDGDQTKYGEWTSVQRLKPEALRSGTYSLCWYEAYNVIGGSTHRATYLNVPPGEYTFRAIGLAGAGETLGDEISFAIKIHPPFWQQVWFLPVVTAAGVAMIAGMIFASHRQRSKRSLERLRFQNALEKDRIRIARDMHDDLGSRVTFINMSAALAQRDIEQAPDNARRHLSKMTESARDLIVAMDGLVWAVDPTHDTLDHLASHLTRLAEEMFRDTAFRCRLDIPPLLPALPLGSDVRHHIALAVKESFHNVLRHAGPCEVFFSLVFDDGQIRITIRDTGVGFDPESDERGHGLDNLASRFKEIGGTCKITSSPGSGTSIILSCGVKETPTSK